MITYVKVKQDILGVIWSSFWGIYTQVKHLRDWILCSNWLNDSPQYYVSFCIFSLLKYNRIFSKNLWVWYLRGKIKSLTQHFVGVSVPGLAPENYVSFILFIIHLSSYDNIYGTETWNFLGNMKVLFGHLYTCWTSEGKNISWGLTKW